MSPAKINECIDISGPKSNSEGGSFYSGFVPVFQGKSELFCYFVCVTKSHLSPVLVCLCGTGLQLRSPGSEHPCPDLAFSSRITLLMSACLSSIKINTFYKTQPSFKYSGSCLCQSPASLLLQVLSSKLKSS